MTDMMRRPLPPGWRWVRLGEMCEEHTGTRDPRLEEKQEFVYVDITSVDNVSKCIFNPKVLPCAEAPSRARQVIYANDVLVSMTRPNLNAVAMVPQDLDNEICSTGFCVLRCRENLNSTYLFAFVQSHEFVQRISDLVKGALYPAVTDNQIREQLIPLPPLPEQQRIVAILSEQMAAIERARAATESQLEAARALPAAYLRAVFNGPEAQQWPRAWLGEMCEINPARPHLNRADNVITSFLPMAAVEESGRGIARIAQRPYGEIRKGYTYFAEGDVLFAKITPCMQNAKHAVARDLIDGVGFGSTEFHVLRPKNEIISEWVHQFVLQPPVLRAAMAHFTGAVGQQRVPDGFLATLEIPLPSLPEQRRIVAILSEQMAAVEKARQALEAQLDAINRLPATLLRQAFNGEI